MVEIQDKTRKLIYDGNAEYITNLMIGETSIDVSNIKSIIITDDILDKEKKYMYIGTFISKKLEIEFKKPTDIDLTKPITLEISVKSFDESEILDTINMGTFYIDTTEKDYYEKAKIIAYDYGVKLKTPMPLEDYGTINIIELLQQLCYAYNIELGTYPSINNDIMISAYDNTLSGKAYCSYIAELLGGNVKIGRDNKLHIIPLKNYSNINIDIPSAESFTLGEKYKITRVTYDNGVLLPSSFGNDENNTLFIRTDNIFISGDDERRNSIVENIYNVVKDFTIYSIEIKNPTDLSLDASDIVNYINGENIYPTYYCVTNNFTKLGTVNVKLPTIEQEKTTNTNDNESVNHKIRTIKTYVDQENSELRTEITNTNTIINNMGNEITEINKTIQTLGDTYTKTEIQQIIHGIGVDGQVVTSTITESGTFDKNGLTIDNTSKENGFKGNFNERGMKVINKNSEEVVLFAGADEKTGETNVTSLNMNVKKYLHIGKHSRMQDFVWEENGREIEATGVFWLG